MSYYGPPPRGPYQPYPEYPPPGGYDSPSDPWGQSVDAWGRQPGAWDGQAYPPDYPPPPGYPPPPDYPPPPGYPEPGYPGSGYPPGGYQVPPPGYDGPPPRYDGPPGRYEEPADREPPLRETLAREPLWGSSEPGRNVGLYATVAVLVVLAAAGVGYALYVLSGDSGGAPAAAGTTAPTQAASAPPASPPGASAAPGDNEGLSAAVAQVGDCLVNDGTAEETQMRIVQCDDQDEDVVYRVLAVFDKAVEGDDDAARHESAQAICADTEGYTHHYFEVGEEPGTSFVLCLAEEKP